MCTRGSLSRGLIGSIRVLLGVMSFSPFALWVGGASIGASEQRGPAGLPLHPGDHVCIIGNTLAERMQHDGWLETYFYSRFPDYDLVFRNLGFSGDELTLRLRSAGFGTPDEHLRINKADVILAFFGYNESYAGAAGLGNFKKDLDDFIKHTLGQKYNGKSAPRLVLFSPIAHEDLGDRNLPDGRENNERIALYTAAMAEVARSNHVRFVNLYEPTLALYAAGGPLTVNGIHLNEAGNKLLAQVIDAALLPGRPAPERDPQAMEALRQAVVEKNFYWFHRHRTVDGYSIYGGRADLQFVDGQTNRVVTQRELEVLDVMTANRDQRIWELAKGGDLDVDDSTTPPFIPVKTNKPGSGPNGEHIFLGGEEAIQKMTVAKGMRVNLFASEKEFPELAKPVQMSFDAQGRLWVAAWPTYPHWKPKEEMNDKLLILEDTDGDGKADKSKVFADQLHCPTGFEFYNGGVLVAQAPYLVFLKDTDGDNRADIRVRVLGGLDSADTHHTANSFILDPGGALYFQEGTFHHTQVETPYGPPERCANAGVFRYEPRTHKFEVYITYGFANPHGHVFDRWGQDIVYDGTGANPYHAALFSGRMEFPQKHATPPQVYQQRTRPCPGVETLSSRHFPEVNQGNLLVANVIGFQGILQYKVADDGSSFAGTELEPILSSSDPSFRPSDIEVGPDGAIYFLDWQNPIIGHMQHNLRDPSRDRAHGRIYRITYEGRPLLKPAKIAGEPIEKLLDLLKKPEDRVRYRAKIELGARDSGQVAAAVGKWVAGLDHDDPDYEHQLLEALWVHQYHNVVNLRVLKRMLGSADFRARAAATRVLCYWRDRVPDALNRLKQLAADPHPRVRLEAVRAASFFRVPEAVEVPLLSADYPSDQYLDFTRGETMKTLDPYVKKAIADGHPIRFTSAAGERYFLSRLSTDELLKLDRTQGVCLAILTRRGVRDEHRQEALAGLAKLRNERELSLLLGTIQDQDEQADGATESAAGDESVVFDLFRLLTRRSAEELADVRPDLEKLALNAKRAVSRQLGFVALVAADGNADAAWALGTQSETALQDLLYAMPLLRDPTQRASLYPKVEPLLAGLPEELAASMAQQSPILGRYVRIELPGKQRTLTFAEAEVYSDGRNVARQGQASQTNTAFGGDASKGIDGNTSGKYADGGQTHTLVGVEDPWWEVDLGAEFPLDSIVVYGRTDGDLDYRLRGFTLQVLDRDRNTVFEKAKQLPPGEKAVYEMGSQVPERVIRRAAMNALASVRGKETEAFQALARFARAPVDRHAAVQALQRIPAAYWPQDEAGPLLESLVAYVRQTPPPQRTAPAVLDAMQLADALASLLPPDEARQARQELGELGVRVIRMATVPDQMLFDKERIVVRAGRPVEIVFENNDLMPHNLVVTQPGALEEIGTLAEATATQRGALERHYVPDSAKIVLASRLLQPRDVQKLSFTAPSEPGVYPYVCTYPGHWRRMYGAMDVVENLEDYLADPEGYLAKRPLPVADELLKFTRPRKEWKLEELASALPALERDRSFSNGKQMFQLASCIACHKLNGTGTELGADLTKLDPKLTPADILRDILEPSFKINEKYQSYVIETQAGKVLTGLIVEQTPDAVKLIENPLASAEPLVLNKSDIAEQRASTTSIMPKGLLDKLTREEILDLLAYVVAGGNPRHALFQGQHAHEHATGR